MDFKELQTKTEQELHDLLATEKHHLRELRFKASEGQLKGVHAIRTARTTIAQILTVLKKRQQAG